MKVNDLTAEQVEAKIEAIKLSKMPQAQKDKYINQLKPVAVDNSNKIPFKVYATIKKVPLSLQGAMLAYPRPKGLIWLLLSSGKKSLKAFKKGEMQCR